MYFVCFFSVIPEMIRFMSLLTEDVNLFLLGILRNGEGGLAE